ncbi:MAG TPA: D-alanyl-D-alanine carboxypeptidase/D-alanyl-D-alanine-endopeptidase [Longimicrobium sp.]|nr:D-alanyl-D-alanine carboxypeptidase/D-alanyl-D-alanine-endopeptidase [Longimicrobium sp.]
MPIRRSLAPLLLALAAACAPAARPATTPAPAPAGRMAIAAALDSIFNDTALAHAHWGVLVRSLDRGETLYARNAGRMFVPASNMKIVTAAAALEALGPDYRYRTQLVGTGPVVNGTLQGDLLVVGSGDPTISARFLGDPRAVFRAWADSLRARNITYIAGHLYGVDDVFDDLPYGRGWAWDDMEDAYSAGISGLPFNEGVVAVELHPGDSVGAPARVVQFPPHGHPTVSVAAVTAPSGTEPDVDFEFTSQGYVLSVSGSVPVDTVFRTDYPVQNNTLYFVEVLHRTLEEAGILADPAADADGIPPGVTIGAGRTVLFTHSSPPMREILAAFLKPSQNQIGEILLKTLGAELRGMGTAGAGAAVIDSMAASWGLPRRLLSQADGSGLSRYNLVAPEFLVALLERETRSPHAQVFADALPVGGRDGTLRTRMRGTPLEANVRAKTGTLSGVRSLSGYVTTAAGERLVFSMVVNHHTLSARDADRVAEAALLRLMSLERAR